MATIQEEILEKFYTKLVTADGFDKDRVDQLRSLFSGKKKPKAAEVIKAFCEDAKESQA